MNVIIVRTRIPTGDFRICKVKRLERKITYQYQVTVFVGIIGKGKN